MSLQELADARVAPEYRQPVKTQQDAMAAIGWKYVDHQKCCGERIPNTHGGNDGSE